MLEWLTFQIDAFRIKQHALQWDQSISIKTENYISRCAAARNTRQKFERIGKLCVMRSKEFYLLQKYVTYKKHKLHAIQ